MKASTIIARPTAAQLAHTPAERAAIVREIEAEIARLRAQLKAALRTAPRKTTRKVQC